MKLSSALNGILLIANICIPVAVHSFSISAERGRLKLKSCTKCRRTQLYGQISDNYDANEFDYLLREVSSSTPNSQSFNSRRQIALTDSGDIRSTILASSFPMPATDVERRQQENLLLQEQREQQEQEEQTNEEIDSDDPYANMLEGQVGKIQKFQEMKQSSALETKMKSMDLQDIVLTLLIPGVLAFVSFRWVYNRASTKVIENKDTVLDLFAKEMLFHDGDLNEMELCILDYKKKLVWLGPSKTEAMLKRYLEMYSKKKTVSPQAIASLSYVFTVFKLSEEKAAQILVSLCKQMGTDKISSAGKLLFFGTRIMKSPEGKKALLPIKELIMSTYREESVAESLVDTSQQAIAEAAYRSTVLASGKKQKSLTPGWEVLGLSKEAATQIYNEEKKIGFVTERETMYGGQSRKYDKKGRQLDAVGKLVDPSEADSDDADGDGSDDENGPVSNVYECGNCGYTIFVAQGRESKFFGQGFKCPECGAPKSDFKARTDMDD